MGEKGLRVYMTLVNFSNGVYRDLPIVLRDSAGT